MERIEERFLRQLLKTGRGCSISQLYLETGHTPARFEVMKMRCLFFKSILKESTESLIFKFIMAQYQNPVRGDWVSCCLNDLKYLNINISIEEIKIMKKTQFKKEKVKIQKEIMKRFSENYEKRKQIVIDPLEPSGRSTVITSLCYNSNG